MLSGESPAGRCNADHKDGNDWPGRNNGHIPVLVQC